MRSQIIAALALAFTGCLAPSTLVVRTEFNGRGVASSNTEHTIIAVDGSAGVGIYQVDELGELRLTRPAAAATDSIYIRDWSSGETHEFPLGEPLPAWTEAVVRAQFSDAQIEAFGLTWAEESQPAEQPSK